jgi:putative membrane protein
MQVVAARRRYPVITRYSDHAANERTFLAWVRTGIPTIAFGFVVEKFNLFVQAIEKANPVTRSEHRLLGKLSGLLGQYDGSALILIGIALIAVAAFRSSAPAGCSTTSKAIRRATSGPS